MPPNAKPQADSSRSDRVAAVAASFGIALMALGLASSKAAQSVGMVLLAAAFLAQLPSAWRMLRTDPLAQLMVLWILYFAMRALVAAWEFPDLRSQQFDELRRMSRILLILAVAWWAHGNTERVVRVLVLALLGLIIASIYYLDLPTMAALFSGDARLRLGQNVQHVGLFFATALIGWILLAARIIPLDCGKRERVLRVALWIAVFCFLAIGVVATQVRAVWVAIFCWIVLFLAYQLFTGRVLLLLRKRTALVLALAALVLASGVLLQNLESGAARIAQESQTVVDVARGEAIEVPLTSFGIRIRLWRVAIDKWTERKWFGWGPGTVPSLIAQSNEAPAVARLAQFHNTALEMLVRGGLVGFLLGAAVMLLLIGRVYRAWRLGNVPTDLATFFVSVLLIFAMVNLTEAYIDRQVGWIYLALFAGLGYSYAFQQTEKQRGARAHAFRCDANRASP